MLGPAFAWFRLTLFVVVLIVSIVLKRWVLVAIVGGCIVWALARAVRARPMRPEPADLAPEPPVVISIPPDADPATGPGDGPKFEMSTKTVAALREQGGNLYIWADDVGLFQASPTAPEEQTVYDRFSSHGSSIYVDREIDLELPLLITWKRLPRPHFSAVYDRSAGQGIVDAIFAAWR